MFGFIALLAIPHPRYPGLTYAMLFLVPGGLYPAIIGVISWIANNLAPSWKRAVGMAFLMTFGNLGGLVGMHPSRSPVGRTVHTNNLIGSNIFLSREAPHYWLGYGLSLALVVIAIVATLLMRILLQVANKRRDRTSEDEIRAKYTEDQLLKMGDRSPLFRYVV